MVTNLLSQGLINPYRKLNMKRINMYCNNTIHMLIAEKATDLQAPIIRVKEQSEKALK